MPYIFADVFSSVSLDETIALNPIILLVVLPDLLLNEIIDS